METMVKISTRLHICCMLNDTRTMSSFVISKYHFWILIQVQICGHTVRIGYVLVHVLSLWKERWTSIYLNITLLTETLISINDLTTTDKYLVLQRAKYKVGRLLLMLNYYRVAQQAALGLDVALHLILYGPRRFYQLRSSCADFSA